MTFPPKSLPSNCLLDGEAYDWTKIGEICGPGVSDSGEASVLSFKAGGLDNNGFRRVRDGPSDLVAFNIVALQNLVCSPGVIPTM